MFCNETELDYSDVGAGFFKRDSAKVSSSLYHALVSVCVCV